MACKWQEKVSFRGFLLWVKKEIEEYIDELMMYGVGILLMVIGVVFFVYGGMYGYGFVEGLGVFLFFMGLTISWVYGILIYLKSKYFIELED